MTTPILFLIIITFYSFTMISIGLWGARHSKTLEDYAVASRKLPLLLAVPALVSTWFGAGSCLGVSGQVFSGNFRDVLPDPFGCTLALILTGVFFAVRFWRSKEMTIADILRKAYGSQFEKVTTLLMLPFYVGTLASQMLAMGTLFHLLFAWPLTWGILAGSAIVIIYTSFGGMWAVTITDFVQFSVIVVGLLLFVPHLLGHQKLPSLFMRELSHLLPSGRSEDYLAYFGQIGLTSLGAIMGQDLIQRLFSCRSAQVARQSALIGAGIYLLLGCIPLAIGILGKSQGIALIHADTILLHYAQEYFSPVLFAVFCAALASAVMSTADGYLLAGSTLLTKNLLLPFIGYGSQSDQRALPLIRISSLILSVLALLLALAFQSIYALMTHSGAILFVGIATPVLFALYNRAVPLLGWVSLLSGTTAWIVSIAIYSLLLGSSDFDAILYRSAFIGFVTSLGSYLVGLWCTKITSVRHKEIPVTCPE